MAEEPEILTREQWIEKVKALGRDEAIRQEMIRLGFWEEKPLSPEEQEQIKREEEELKKLQQEYMKLREEVTQLEDTKRILKEIRKKRIEESRRRRERAKIKRLREKKDAKQRWKEYTTTHIVHVGVGVSYDLEAKDVDEDKLNEYQLPKLKTEMDLANELGISLSKLKWLTFHRKTATINHYFQFSIPKKGGGRREISAPKWDLRQAQSWIKEKILDQIPIHDRAFGFVKGRSILDNARPHVNKDVVIKIDLKDFFPTITFHRVKGLFQSFGYSGRISTLLALLTTEPPRKKVEFDGKYYYVALGKRQLPQGACTSPSIANIICRRLDKRLNQVAEKYGYCYTRYADDLTFSCGKDGMKKIGALIREVKNIIEFEGFQVNEKKVRILRSTGCQKVTGIVVNEKLNISRKDLKNFRALLYNVEKNGLEKENRNNHKDFWRYIQGYTSYIQMVRPDVGKKFAEQVKRIEEKYGLVSI